MSAPDTSSAGAPEELGIAVGTGPPPGVNVGGANIAGVGITGAGIGGAGIGGAGIAGAIDAGTAIGDASVGEAIGATGAIDGGSGSGIEAGIGSGDDEPRNDAPATTAIGAGVRSGWSDAVVTRGFRSRGCAIGAVEGELVLVLVLAFGATDGVVRGAADAGAGGATEGVRGAIGAWLARGGIDAGLAADTGASAGASVMRRVPGASLAGGVLLVTVPTGARSFVSSASASAMSGGSPCAVAASS